MAKECPGEWLHWRYDCTKCSRGSLVHNQQCKIPSGKSKVWRHGRWRRLPGRAILFGVCPQSCQFRSPGQKSFYLLNQMLCRTKCQAYFKVGRCAEPQALIALSHCSRLQPWRSSPSSLTADTTLSFSPCSPFPLKTFWRAFFLPADYSRGRRFKDGAPSPWNQSYPALPGCRGVSVVGVDFVKDKH